MSRKKKSVKVDISSLTTGVSLEVTRSVINLICWLHLENDMQHINLSELYAMLKDINLVLL